MLGVSFVQEFVCVFNSSTTHVLLRGLRLRTSYPQCPTGRETKYRHSNIYSAAVNDPVIISTNNYLFANESNLGNIRSLSLYILSWGSSGNNKSVEACKNKTMSDNSVKVGHELKRPIIRLTKLLYDDDDGD